MLVGRIKCIFVALVGVFAVCAARADSCNLGEYMVCDPDPYDNSCTDCGCASCPVGQTSDGTGVVYRCPYETGSSGCYDAGYCAGFDTCPDDVPLAQYRKCKPVTDCGGVGGCTGYKLCNIVNGEEAGFFIPADNQVCHLEGSTCYANERACNLFDVSADYGQWSCQKSHQTGNAQWTPSKNAWDTSDCQCSMTNMNIDTTLGTTVKCQNANATYRVADAYKYNTKKVTDPVYYIPARRYCAQCYPGYVPHSVNPFSVWQDGGETYSLIQYPSGGGGLYGVVACDNLVVAPYYADGCIIDWIKPSGTAAQNACKISCDTGMETVENGATDASFCVPAGATYTDATGTFRLGSDSGVCGN